MREWNDTRADPLLPEHARSECARSTAAGGSTRVPFQEREASEFGRIIERRKCSFDTRSKGQSGDSHGREGVVV